MDWSRVNFSREAWPEPNKKVIGKRKNYFYESIKPLLITFRLTGRLSYSLTQDGEMTVKILSPWTVYAILLYAFQSYIVVASISAIFDDLKSSSGKIEDSLLGVTRLLVLAVHFLIPFIMVREWPCSVRFFQSWVPFEDKYRRVTGRVFDFKLSRLTLITAVLMVPFNGLIFYEISTIFYSGHFLIVIPYMTGLFHIYLVASIWIFNCTGLVKASSQIQTNFHEALNKHGHTSKASEIFFSYRELWIELSQLTRQVGDSFSVSMISFILLKVIIFVTSSYALLSSVVYKKYFDSVAFSIILTYSGGFLYVIIEAAHQVSKRVEDDFKCEIFNRNTALFDNKAAHEAEVFLTTIEMGKPVIQIAGFFTINRSVCVSLMSSTVTYLIVLIQFKSSEDELFEN